jgi:hypothetical protein
MSELQLATRTSITAFYSRSQLLIIAEGSLPTPDWEIDIGQEHAREIPPTFSLSRRPRPTDTGDEETPFRYGEIFTIGRPPDHIVVQHIDGEDKVPVEFTDQELVDIVLSLSLDENREDVIEIPMLDDLEDDAPRIPAYGTSGASTSGTELLSNHSSGTAMVGQAIMGASLNLDSDSSSSVLTDLNVRYRESVGYSNKLSFDEAFADALKKLPSPSMKFPDMMETVEVVHIGGTFGGIAGFHRLEVRIRAYPD